MLRDSIATESIYGFAPVVQQADVQPSEPIFVLSSSQLQDIISRAVLPLQDEISQLKVTVAQQGEDIAALKSTERLNFDDIRDLYTAIGEIEQRQQIKPQPLQKDRGEILRALLAANGGKMLAKDARQKMRLDEATFSRLLEVSQDHIEKKSYHFDRRQSILIIK